MDICIRLLYVLHQFSKCLSCKIIRRLNVVHVRMGKKSLDGGLIVILTYTYKPAKYYTHADNIREYKYRYFKLDSYLLPLLFCVDNPLDTGRLM